jgi:hypothetical protein
MAPEVGFEPTTNRLTADRSTTELLWITQLKKESGYFRARLASGNCQCAKWPADRRIWRRCYDTLGTMKALFSIFLALGVCVGSVQAGPVRTARNVAKDTAITAKNVAHSAVKGTRRAVHTVVYRVTR